jgi:hypothetical protein
MRANKHAFAPGAEKFALAIKDGQWVLTAAEDINAISGIGSHTRDFAEAPAGR